MNDEYFLDQEDDELDPDDSLIAGVNGESDDDDDGDSDSSTSDSSGKVDSEAYKDGNFTQNEVWLIKNYDEIAKSTNIEDAATIVIMANPQHTSIKTINDVVKDLFNKQGHNRMNNTRYQPDQLMRGEEIGQELGEDDDDSFNSDYAREAKEQVNRFVAYLSNRDLSEDSVISRRRKQRQLAAFIIFLFSANMYDLLLGLPDMPDAYQRQIDNALKKINEGKYAIVEELAQKYEEMGRQKVADRVRDASLGWFQKEPAEIRWSAEYRDLELTSADIAVYRDYRARFTNTSSALTQDLISEYIEVVIDADKGIFEKLRDKTRTDAINDAKKEFQNFVENVDSEHSDLAKRIVFKTLK